MRWKALFYNKKDKDDGVTPERFELKSDICPTQKKELVPFEEELIQLTYGTNRLQGNYRR